MIRILLVEDHASFREALAFVINHEPDLAVVAQANSVAEARTALADADIAVDIAVVDLHLPDGSGISIVKELRKVNPKAMALILTASIDPMDTASAVEAGAAGVLHKSAAIDEIVAGLRRLAAGEWLLSTSEVVGLLNLANHQRELDRDAQFALKQLTPREREVLQALAEGLDSKEIARQLYITIETERTHMVNILSKLGVHTRLQALVFAVRHGAAKIQ